MSIWKRFYPTEYARSIYGLDFDRLYREGYRGVIMDIDNTLVPHGLPADGQAVAFFARLREIGFQTCLLSNNKEPRVEPFARAVGTNYIFKADKPSRKGYRAAMDRMGTDVNTTIFIGDQLFTDIYGANRTGIRSVLVEPIDPKEEIQIVWKRKLEAIVLGRKREMQH